MSIDSEIQNEIKKTISALIAQRKPFSAYDITTALREHGYSGKHNDFKSFVHSLFFSNQMNDYLRGLVQYPHAPIPAWLYHPPEIDPTDPNVMASLISGQPIITKSDNTGGAASVLNPIFIDKSENDEN